MTFPAVRSSSSGSGGNFAAHTITLPASISAGDAIVVMASVDGFPASITLPGYTAIYNGAGAGDWFRATLFIAAKVADGSEAGTTVDLTLPIAEAAEWIVYAIQDFTGVLSDIEISLPVEGSNVAAYIPTDVTASWGIDDNLFLAMASVDDGLATITAFPTDYTSNQITVPGALGTASGCQTLSAGTKTAAAASSTVDAFTAAVADDWLGFTIAVRGTAVATFAIDSTPANIREGSPAAIVVSGSAVAPTPLNTVVRADDAAGPQATVDSITGTGPAYTINFTFPANTPKQFDDTAGISLYIAIGAENNTSAALPYLPPAGTTYYPTGTADTLSNDSVYFNHTADAPSAGDQYVCPTETDQGIAFTVTPEGYVNYATTPAITQTFTGHVRQQDGTIGASGTYTFTITVNAGIRQICYDKDGVLLADGVNVDWTVYADRAALKSGTVSATGITAIAGGAGELTIDSDAVGAVNDTVVLAAILPNGQTVLDEAVTVIDLGA